MSDAVSLCTALRKRVSALVEALKVELKSAERTLCMRSLQVAKAHLGKVLYYSGVRDPYAYDSERRRLGLSEDIPPEVHTSDPFRASGDRVAQDDEMREEIASILRELETFYISIMETPARVELFDHIHWCRQHLIEARFWLGYDLGEIRDSREAAHAG